MRRINLQFIESCLDAVLADFDPVFLMRVGHVSDGSMKKTNLGAQRGRATVTSTSSDSSQRSVHPSTTPRHLSRSSGVRLLRRATSARSRVGRPKQ